MRLFASVKKVSPTQADLLFHMLINNEYHMKIAISVGVKYFVRNRHFYLGSETKNDYLCFGQILPNTLGIPLEASVTVIEIEPCTIQ